MLKKVNINGDAQWIYTYGNKQKPILLFLSGGPGLCELTQMETHLPNLGEEFLVVTWDKRGEGKSFSFLTSKQSLTLDQMVEDIQSLVLYLTTAYNQEKVYLAGHSFGSIIGLKAIHRYPELFYGYLGVGQVIDMNETDLIGYEYTMTEARNTNDTKTIQALEKIGPPPYKKTHSYTKFRQCLDRYGGFYYEKPLNALRDIVKPVWISKAYGLLDMLKWIAGFRHSIAVLWEEMEQVDFEKEIDKIDVPLYFVTGEKDYITPHCLVERFVRKLSTVGGMKAPVFIIKETAHYVYLEKPDDFRHICLQMKEKKQNNSL